MSVGDYGTLPPHDFQVSEVRSRFVEGACCPAGERRFSHGPLIGGARVHSFPVLTVTAPSPSVLEIQTSRTPHSSSWSSNAGDILEVEGSCVVGVRAVLGTY